MIIASPAWALGPNPEDCDVAGLTRMSDLVAALSRRAVDAVSAAGRQDGEDRLAGVIASDAAFSLGSGDVVRSLGHGVDGARAMAREMKPDTFRFLGWDYIPTPAADPCGEHKVDVEFVNIRSQTLFPTTFTFRAGRIVDAAGWSRSYVTGPVDLAED